MFLDITGIDITCVSQECHKVFQRSNRSNQSIYPGKFVGLIEPVGTVGTLERLEQIIPIHNRSTTDPQMFLRGELYAKKEPIHPRRSDSRSSDFGECSNTRKSE